MKPLLRPGLIAGLSLAFALSAIGQTQNTTAANTNTQPLPIKVHDANAPEQSHYDYDFIEKSYVWSNKPLHATASKVCKTMKDDRAFSETAYAINGDQDWNNCLDMQIRSIGYLRWLKNEGFKANSKNRKMARNYLKEHYTMQPWGGYSFEQLSSATNMPLPGPASTRK